MKKNITKAICVLTVIMLFSGCVFVSIGDPAANNAVRAQGERETYEIKTGTFSDIKIEGAFEIRYYAGSSDTVTLEVQPNIQKYIEVLVENNELIVRSTRRISYGLNKGMILTVYAPALNQITIEGAGKFTAYDKITSSSLTLITRGAGSGKAELDVNNLTVNVSGAGSFELSGKAETANINLSGAGEIKALSLQTSDAAINMSGAGSIKVSCSGKLGIKADGTGSIEYRGSPNVSLNTNGLVSVRQIN